MNNDDGFLSRWSRRKAQVRQGGVPEPVPEPLAAPPGLAGVPTATPAPASAFDPAAPDMAQAHDAAPAAAAPADLPLPTLEDVARLPPDAADYSRFVAARVSPDVRNAAMKKLFTDPHFNVMDGLDVYIDDYGRPDPLPAGMLRQMVQSRLLGFVTDEPEPDQQAQPPAAAVAAPATDTDTDTDTDNVADDTALDLEPAGPAAPRPDSAGTDAA